MFEDLVGTSGDFLMVCYNESYEVKDKKNTCDGWITGRSWSMVVFESGEL